MSRVVITDLDVLVTVDDGNRILERVSLTCEDGVIVAIDPVGAEPNPLARDPTRAARPRSSTGAASSPSRAWSTCTPTSP